MTHSKYKITELDQARQDFRAVFNAGLNEFLEDRKLIAMLQQIIIDIVAFDKYLDKTHPESEGWAMIHKLKHHYGESGIDLINKLSP